MDVGDIPRSPVHNDLKFSLVLGHMSAKSSNSILPAGRFPIWISKNTLGLTITLYSILWSIVQNFFSQTEIPFKDSYCDYPRFWYLNWLEKRILLITLLNLPYWYIKLLIITTDRMENNTEANDPNKKQKLFHEGEKPTHRSRAPKVPLTLLCLIILTWLCLFIGILDCCRRPNSNCCCWCSKDSLSYQLERDLQGHSWTEWKAVQRKIHGLLESIHRSLRLGDDWGWNHSQRSTRTWKPMERYL